MADHSQSMSYNAGEAKGHAEKDQMVDKASGAMQSAKESFQQAQGASDTVKEATGMKK
ncbi:hypothetical protein MKX03_024131 [Papaver bracteatum]|nr:hypothetical protein MKX03_024131 [Papaver bracteatum]